MRRAWGFFPAILIAGAGIAEAQVDEALLTRRWKVDDSVADTYDHLFITGVTHFEDTREQLRLWPWFSEGRIRFEPTNPEPDVWLGYRLNSVAVWSRVEFYNHNYADVALAAGFRLGTLGDWTIRASAGIGTANDGRWDETEAIFPVAALDFTRKTDALTAWHVGLSLDGARSVCSSFPLPYVEYETQVSPALRLIAGFPRSELVLRPFDPMIVQLNWLFPGKFLARVEADLGEGFSVYACASRRIDGYHLRDAGRDRIFLVMNSVEAGFRWVPTDWMDVSLTAGYSFGNRFFSGYDLRSRTALDSFDNVPFIALTLPGTSWAAPLSSGQKY